MGLKWKALQQQGTPLAEGVGDEEAAVDTGPLGEGSEEADSDSDPDAVKSEQSMGTYYGTILATGFDSK